MKKLTKSQIIKLVSLLESWSDAYHNGTAIVSDAKYDKHIDLLEYNDPGNEFLTRVGALPTTGKKTRLPHIMPSLDKIRPGRGAEKFLSSAAGILHLLDKLDGASILLKNIDGTIRMFTRGNGTIGQDVSHMIPYVKGIGKLKKNEAVRGELMMAKSKFGSWAKEYENPRNLVSGIVNSRKKIHKAIKSVELIIHEQVHPALHWSKARVKLKTAGFKTVNTVPLKQPTVSEVIRVLNERRAKSDFDMDGLVLIDSHGGRIAFKIDEDPVQVVVDHVEWNLSKNGIYKPIVKLTKAHTIGGVSVKQVTGHNAKRVQADGIGPGAIILVIRSGDVIPKIVGIKKKAKPQLPENFKWDSTKTEAIATKLTKTDKHVIKTKQLTEAFKILGIDGVRSAVASKLVEKNVTLAKLFGFNKSALRLLDIGDANTDKLYAGLQAAKKNATHPQLMWASNVWPQGFTDTRFQAILDNISFKLLISVSEMKLISKISLIHGMSVATAKVFVKYLDDYEDFLYELGWQPKAAKKVAVGGRLDGMTFVFTRFRNKDLEEQIKANGGKIAGSVTKTTTAVIAASTSTKTVKAEALGVPVYDVNKFVAKYKL